MHHTCLKEYKPGSWRLELFGEDEHILSERQLGTVRVSQLIFEPSASSDKKA